MGWVVATCILGVVTFTLLCLLAAAAHMIMKMYAWRVSFEDELSDRIDRSVHMLDQSHMDIVTVANTPVFFDSPEVRRVVNAVKRARDAVVNVTELLVDVEIEENDQRAELTTPTGPHDEREPVPTKTSQIEDALKSGAVLNFPNRGDARRRRPVTHASAEDVSRAAVTAEREASYMSLGARKAAIAAARGLKKVTGGG